VIILIVAKLGNGSQLHLGFAHVPVKSALHMVWIVLLLRRGGSDVSSIPNFSDRGNLLAASRILQNDHGLTLSIKFCLEHLIRNVVSKFSVSKAATGSLCAIMASMQSSATIDTFITATHRLMAMLDPTRLGGKTTQAGLDPSTTTENYDCSRFWWSGKYHSRFSWKCPCQRNDWEQNRSVWIAGSLVPLRGGLLSHLLN
jgi:hypothetical protein